MSSQDPGPRPDPQTEPSEPNPGGADAVHAASADGVEHTDPVPADLDPASNPAVEDVLPDEMRQGEDTDTKATREGDDPDDVDPEDDSPV